MVAWIAVATCSLTLGMARAAPPAQKCQADADAFCERDCLPHIAARPCTGPLLARKSGPTPEEWRCYSPSTLDSTNETYVSGTCYCSRDKPIREVLAKCEDPPAFEPVDIFTSGLDGYHTYRIPALVTASTGDLLLFAEGRKFKSSDHDWNDIVMKRSADGGKTWGNMQVGSWDCHNRVPADPILTMLSSFNLTASSARSCTENLPRKNMSLLEIRHRWCFTHHQGPVSSRL